MFDLIGFWTVVSILTFASTAIGWPIMAFLVEHLVEEITGDNKMARKAGERVFNEGSSCVILMGRLKIPEGLFIPSAMFSLIFWPIYNIIYWIGTATDKNVFSITEVVGGIAIHTSSFMGYVGVFLLAYYGTILVGRQFWKLKVKVDEVIEKTSN